MELLVALVLFGIVATGVLRALDRQVRLHTAVLARLEARSQHAATHELVAVGLRSASPPAGDIQGLTDSAVVFRLALGGGVVCALGGTRVVLAPDSLANGQVLARLQSAPQAGDTVWLLDEGPSDATIDDRWKPARVVTGTRAAGDCAGGGVLAGPDAAASSWGLDLSATLSPTIPAGTVARLTRVARFSLYRSGADWWLGFAERAVSGGWNTIQPVSGPYLPFLPSTPAASGVTMAALGASGVPVAGTPSMASLRLATRTLTRLPLRLDGLPRGLAGDSLHSVIALRNAR